MESLTDAQVIHDSRADLDMEQIRVARAIGELLVAVRVGTVRS